MDLDREDMMEAVTEGVRQAFFGVASSQGRFDIPHELLYEAIRRGVEDAIWRVATNATQAPCADFYDTIKEGVADGMARFHGKVGQVMQARDDTEDTRLSAKDSRVSRSAGRL